MRYHFMKHGIIARIIVMITLIVEGCMLLANGFCVKNERLDLSGICCFDV